MNEVAVNVLSAKRAVISTHSNEKGGVGKSTIQFNQAYRLAEQGKRVLVADFDGQRNISKLLLGSMQAVEAIEKSGFTSAELFLASTEPENIKAYQSVIHENIHVIPAHKGKIAGVLAAGAQEAVKMVSHPKRLLSLLDYDYILIDTPPSLGVTQAAAINAVDYLFIPVAIDDFSNEGLISLLQTMNAIKSQLKSEVKLAAVYINHYQKPASRKGDNPYETTLQNIERQYAKYLISVYIPDSRSINESRMAGKAAWVQPPNGNAAAVGRTVRNAIDEMNSKLV